jgi:cytochrome P450 family 6
LWLVILQALSFVFSFDLEALKMDWLFLLNILLGFLSLVFLYLTNKNQYWEKRNVPFVKPRLFYGNAKGLGRDFHAGELIRRLYVKLKPLGPIGGIYLYTRTVAIVMNLDLVKSILVKDFNTFMNRGSYSNEKDDPLSAHLVNLEDDPWKNLRQKLTPTFTSGKIKMMFSIIIEKADKLVKTMEKETESTGKLEIKDILSRFTTDVIGASAFGIECNSLEDKSTKFFEIGLKAFNSINFFKRAFLQTYRDLARKLHMKSSNKEIGDFYIGVVKETIKYRKENPEVQRNDFMNLLINLKDSGVLTFNQIAAQTVSKES